MQAPCQQEPELADGIDFNPLVGGVGTEDGRPERDHLDTGKGVGKDPTFDTGVSHFQLRGKAEQEGMKGGNPLDQFRVRNRLPWRIRFPSTVDKPVASGEAAKTTGELLLIAQK